ncbi:MAG: cytochrome c family protein [Candidatus Neomarinimicrobiota bacterium]
MVRLLTIGFVLAFSVLQAGDPGEYVGINSCKMCHKSAEKGNMHGLWSETAHATALATLKSDAALKYAKERGLETPPSESGDCLVCHMTGYDQGGYEVLSAEFIADEANKRAVKKNKGLENVTCEACHGAGKGYKSKKTMTGIFNGTIVADSVGLIKPTEETCRGCHNEKSPGNKEFNYEEGLAKIAHPYPEGMRP